MSAAGAGPFAAGGFHRCGIVKQYCIVKLADLLELTIRSLDI
jgi:hypothetical protein